MKRYKAKCYGYPTGDKEKCLRAFSIELAAVSMEDAVRMVPDGAYATGWTLSRITAVTEERVWVKHED